MSLLEHSFKFNRSQPVFFGKFICINSIMKNIFAFFPITLFGDMIEFQEYFTVFFIKNRFDFLFCENIKLSFLVFAVGINRCIETAVAVA